MCLWWGHQQCQVAPGPLHGPVPARLCGTSFRGVQLSGMVLSLHAWVGACGDSPEMFHTGVDHSASCRLLAKPPVLCRLSTSGFQGALGSLAMGCQCVPGRGQEQLWPGDVGAMGTGAVPS